MTLLSAEMLFVGHTMMCSLDFTSNGQLMAVIIPVSEVMLCNLWYHLS